MNAGCFLESKEWVISRKGGGVVNCPWFFAGITPRIQRNSGEKKDPKPKLFGPDILWRGGVLPRERAGAKKFGMSLETREIKLSGRDILGFCWDIPAVPEKFDQAQNSLCLEIPNFREPDLESAIFSLLRVHAKRRLRTLLRSTCF